MEATICTGGCGQLRATPTQKGHSSPSTHQKNSAQSAIIDDTEIEIVIERAGEEELKATATNVLELLEGNDIEKARNLIKQQYIRLESDQFEILVNDIHDTVMNSQSTSPTPLSISVDKSKGNTKAIYLSTGTALRKGRLVRPRRTSRSLLFRLFSDVFMHACEDGFEIVAARYQSLLSKNGRVDLEADRALLAVASSLPELEGKRLLQTAERMLAEYDRTHKRQTRRNHLIKVEFADLCGDGKKKELTMFMSSFYTPGFCGLPGKYEIEMLFGPLPARDCEEFAVVKGEEPAQGTLADLIIEITGGTK